NVRRQGYVPLTAERAHRAMARLLAAGRATGVIVDADWARMGEALGHARPALLSSLIAPPAARDRVGTAVVARLKAAAASEREALLIGFLQGEVQAVLGLASPPDPTAGFFEQGLDSLMALQLRNRIDHALGLSLPATLAMDHPTIEAVARHLGTEHFGLAGAVLPGPVAASARADEPVVIVGLACRVPGADDAEGFWRLLTDGRSGIVELPQDRFDVAAYYDPDPTVPGKIYTRRAGLVSGIDTFDAAYFAISPREALTMDPQQRLLLETSVSALEAAGLPVTSLRASRTGVYVGVGPNEYAALRRSDDPEAVDVHTATGGALSVIAGRVAFALGLEGPAAAIDTACSSSLVAVHQAVAGLQRGDADLALAGGVNVLGIEWMLSTCRARMLSADGLCKTFD
ncbi:beta-ketoacyl synthase N-terminal-like domain-containing protein, partial [Rhodoplanes sp. SY1]|uniref:type I polyketide synthase n=1 Tax=Rhodoplanes sp. SY1 TaxID=3166646 RepID=UPI0038B4C4FA